MLCEKCKAEMAAVCTIGVQGWLCPICGWIRKGPTEFEL